MAGYLDNYGAGDDTRSRIVKKAALYTVIAAVVVLAAFLFFHNRTETNRVREFLSQIRSQNYQQAYQMWGCTPQTPCRDYAFQKFMEDWGPQGRYPDPNATRLTTVDSCGTGVVVTIEYPNAEPFGLYVDRQKKDIGFAPWPRCPGRHWHFWEFIQRKVG